MPGMIVETVGFGRIQRRASSGIVMPAGTSGPQRLGAIDAGLEVLGDEVVFRQSPSGQRVCLVSVPVSVPSSNGTRAITPMFSSRQSGNSSSSGAWSKML